MDLKLDLHATEEFRREVKQLIQGQVRGILREELAGIVSGEIAKLRLLQPDCPMLADMVAHQTKMAVQKHIASADMQMRNQVRDLISYKAQEILHPQVDNLRTQIRQEMIRALQNQS